MAYDGQTWKRQIIRIAEDFNYPKVVIEKLKKTKNEDEASKIMCNARHGIF